MLGSEENAGIIFLTLEELFKKIELYSSEKEYNVRLSYLEIYNENIRDLLTNNSEENLDLREDPQKGLIVTGINELNACSCKEVMFQLRSIFLYLGKGIGIELRRQQMQMKLLPDLMLFYKLWSNIKIEILV